MFFLALDAADWGFGVLAVVSSRLATDQAAPVLALGSSRLPQFIFDCPHHFLQHQPHIMGQLCLLLGGSGQDWQLIGANAVVEVFN